VANLLVMMEFYRGALLPVSLEVLGQARRLGSALGMTVYALVPLPPEPAEDEDITVRCGRFGADKVMLLTGDALFIEHEMRFEHFGEAMVAACTMLPPRLLMMGDTPAARDILPRLAARLGAAYLARGVAMAVEQRLIFCDRNGRHLRIPLEAASSEGIPPLIVPVMLTVPPGRHEMAWGDQDAELMIVPDHDESAQTIPNLAITHVPRGGFVEEAVEPQALLDTIAWSSVAAGATETDKEEPALTTAPLWQVSFGSGADVDHKDAASPLWRVSIGPDADPTANYRLTLPANELPMAVAKLRGLLGALGGVAPIVNPGPQLPPVKNLEGFDDSNEFTPTGEPWDYSGDTLSGEEETTARIRQVLSEPPRSVSIPPISSAATPPLHAMDAQRSLLNLKPISVAPAKGQDAAMWEGFATLPDEEDVPVDENGEPYYDAARADTAPVPVVTPGIGKPKGGA
jgi:hypothetical protein